MITIKWTSKDDLNDVIACGIILGKDVSKLKEILDKKGHVYSSDTVIKNNIQDTLATPSVDDKVI
jgi:hypothetical protein